MEDYLTTVDNVEKRPRGPSTISGSEDRTEVKGDFGDYVYLNKVYELTDRRVGTVKYIGYTDFKEGIEWIGLKMHAGSAGKHDGTVFGISYFKCSKGRGLFVPISKINSEKGVPPKTAVKKQVESPPAEPKPAKKPAPKEPEVKKPPTDPPVEQVEGDGYEAAKLTRPSKKRPPGQDDDDPVPNILMEDPDDKEERSNTVVRLPSLDLYERENEEYENEKRPSVLDIATERLSRVAVPVSEELFEIAKSPAAEEQKSPATAAYNLIESLTAEPTESLFMDDNDEITTKNDSTHSVSEIDDRLVSQVEKASLKNLLSDSDGMTPKKVNSNSRPSEVREPKKKLTIENRSRDSSLVEDDPERSNTFKPAAVLKFSRSSQRVAEETFTVDDSKRGGNRPKTISAAMRALRPASAVPEEKESVDMPEMQRTTSKGFARRENVASGPFDDETGQGRLINLDDPRLQVSVILDSGGSVCIGDVIAVAWTVGGRITKDMKTGVKKAMIAGGRKMINKLNNLFPQEKRIPVYCRAGHKNEPWDKRKKWKYYWVVDPLCFDTVDGLKKGDFSLNIALVSPKGIPILGVVYSPVLDILYWSLTNHGAFQRLKNGKIVGPLKIQAPDSTMPTPHLPPEVARLRNLPTDRPLRLAYTAKPTNVKFRDFVKELGGAQHVDYERVSPALGLVGMAGGQRDVFFAYGVAEYQVCAAQAILSAAGGHLLAGKDSRPKNAKAGVTIRYGKIDRDKKLIHCYT